MVGDDNSNVVIRCYGDELLGEALEKACPLRQIVNQLQEREGDAVDDEEADRGPLLKKAGQQVEFRQQLHVVMATHLR